MRETLASIHAPVAGIVLNDKTGKSERYSYYGSRYYRYGKRYGYGYGYNYGYGYYSDDEAKHHKKQSRWEKFIKFLPEKWRKKLKM
jgi:tyrosine-protein kinase Etk/Wzc